MEELLVYLNAMPSGVISDTSKIGWLLSDAWDEFEGSDAEGMQSDKLRSRMEDVSWNAPYLTFCIERHGATQSGSSRAELQEWKLDTEAGTAMCCSGRYRQLTPRQAPLNVKPIAAEIVNLILTGQQDTPLKWNADGSVRVLIGQIIPDDSAKQTTLGRRRRFRTEVDRLLSDVGWSKVKENHFAPPSGIDP